MMARIQWVDVMFANGVCSVQTEAAMTNIPKLKDYQIPGKSNALNVEDIGDLNPRISVVAEVFNYIENDSKPPFIRVKQGSHFANLQFNDNIWKNISSKLATKIQKGSILLVDGVCPSANWKGEVSLKFDPHSNLEIVDKSEPQRDSITSGSPG